MGTFAVGLQVANDLGAGFTPVECLVDTGSSYTTLPGSLLRDLGVKPISRRNFLLANGESVSREIGQARVRLDGHELVTVVVFGDEAAMPLLGAVTLEEMGLGVDPLAQKLVDVPGYLLSHD